MMKRVTRREFMVDGSILIGGAVGGLALGNELFFSKKVHAGKVEFPEPSCGLEKKTGKKVLVAYASQYGSTGGVADAIGKELCNRGAAVDVCMLKNVGDLNEYRGVVVGTAIYRGKWLTEAVDFVERNRGVLRQVPVAYFLVCMTMREPVEENRRKALAYLDPVLKAVPQVQPVQVGAFAGALNYSNLSSPIKVIMKLKGAPEGDFRDWTAIRTWADGLGSTLLASGGKKDAAR
jgi:menaquinone-dependent protoporphyrinogen oxidase